MKKVLVIGCPGAGKSRFSRILHEKTGLPLYHLDAIWHKPDKTTLGREEFDSRLDKILSTPEWIIDGCYPRTLPVRMRYCDTVFFFDYSVDDCLAGAVERLGKRRDDIQWCETCMDETFRKSIVDFPEIQRPKIISLFESFRIRPVIFHNREETDRYLNYMPDVVR